MSLSKEEKDKIKRDIHEQEKKKFEEEERKKFIEKTRIVEKKKIRSKGFLRDVLDEVFKK